MAGLGGLGHLRRGCFRRVGRIARGPGASGSESNWLVLGDSGPASRPRTRRSAWDLTGACWPLTRVSNPVAQRWTRENPRFSAEGPVLPSGH